MIGDQISSWCPYVRYARQNEHRILQGQLRAIDHRLFYCHSGSGFCQIDGKLLVFQPGTVVYIPAGTPYRLLFGEEIPVFSGCNFDFYQAHAALSQPIPPVPAAVFREDKILEKQILSGEGAYILPLHLENAFQLEHSFLELAREYKRHNRYFDVCCSSILKTLLIRLLQLREAQELGINDQKVDAILQYIHSHCDRKLTNREIATRFGYHPYYISTLVLKYTGMPLHQYVLKYKMDTAVGLLQSTDMTIGEVAARVAMPDIKHFSKCFTRIVGTPPSHFKPGSLPAEKADK